MMSVPSQKLGSERPIRPPLRDLNEDGTARPYRVARVAAEERGQPAPILEVKRLIEPEVRAQTRELLGRESRRGSEPRRNGVAGQQPYEEEREERDADQCRDGAEQSLREISAHASRSDRSLITCRARSVGDR